MTRTISIKNYLRIGLFTGLFAFIIIYSIFQTKAIAKGADVTINGIENGQIFKDSFVELQGVAVHANHLSINGKELVIDEKNNFTDELVLSPGYNIITVEAKDRFDKKTKKVYEVFYDENQENPVVKEDTEPKIISANK